MSTRHQPSSQENDGALGLMHTWWRGDPLPPLPPLAGVTIALIDDRPLLIAVTGLDDDELRQRQAAGNRAWVAVAGDEPAGYGWVATRQGSVGSLDLSLTFGPDERYLWDFVTLPAWRGQGIYPRIIQEMVRNDPAANRFWIGHDLDNEASRRGIAKAGFQCCGVLYPSPATRYRLHPGDSPIERTAAGARVLGVPFAPE